MTNRRKEEPLPSTTHQIQPAPTQTDPAQPVPTAFLYLRVSTPSQVNKAINPEGYSIPAQREACLRHIAQAVGAELIGEYVEPGRSATSLNRPALQELLADLPEKKPDYVVVYDLSRIARDDFDALWLLREVTSRGAKLESVLEPIDDSAAGRFMYTMFAGANAFFSRRDGEKVKAGLERKFLAGGASGPARIGYLNARKWFHGREVAVIEVDPDRRDYVRLGFDLYKTGNYTLATLTDVLAEAGLRTRATPKKPSRPLSRSSVHRMLGDDFYIGIVTHNGKKLRGLHEPLIDEATFEQVQHVLAAHQASGDRSHKHKHHLIGAIFVCDECNRRLGYGRHRGRGGIYEYFSCLSRVSRDGRCDAPYLRVESVEEAMADYHAGLTYTAAQQQRIRQAVRDFVAPRVEQARKQAEAHERRLRELLAEQQQMAQLSYKGLIDDEVLALEQERIKTERQQARRWLETAVYEVQVVMEALDDALALASEHLPYATLPPTARKLLNQATHERIAPVITDDPDDRRACRIHGQRNPLYVEADLIVGKTPPELDHQAAEPAHNGHRRPQTAQAPTSRGLGSDETRMAEGVGFEPTVDQTADNGFRDSAVGQRTAGKRRLFGLVVTAVATAHSQDCAGPGSPDTGW